MHVAGRIKAKASRRIHVSGTGRSPSTEIFTFSQATRRPAGGLTAKEIRPELVRLSWEQAAIVPGYDSYSYRKDQYGARIRRSLFGRRDSLYGWDILFDLGPLNEPEPRPLQCRNKERRKRGEPGPAVIGRQGMNVSVES